MKVHGYIPVVFMTFFASDLQAISSQRHCAFEPPWSLNITLGAGATSGTVVVGGGAGGGPGNSEYESRPCSIRNRYLYHDAEQFYLHTAAECFYYTGAKYLLRRPCLALPFVCLNSEASSFDEADCHLAKIDEPDGALARALSVEPPAEVRWVTCVKDAAECCHRMRTYTQPSGYNHCNATWDGLTCFDDTPANSTVETPCPRFLYARQPKCSYKSSRICRADGTWGRKANGNEEYTNYAGCIPREREEEIAPVYYFAIALFTLSVMFCLPAVIIFSSFRSLRCQRISMHKQLVMSVMLSSLLQLIEHSILTLPSLHRQQRPAYTEAFVRSGGNAWWCKVLQVLQKYFWASQFSWMLCEGVYLHTLVSQAFVDYRSLTAYYIFGWGVPAICVVIYAVLSACFADIDCWRSITVYDYIVTGPATLCLLLNVVLMVRVVVIIVTKLRGPDNSGDETSEGNLRRVFRAVLLLTPLFGVHYVVSMFASGAACANALLSSYISWFCVSSQGVFVSLMLCYCNGEVQFQLRRAYNRFVDGHRFELVTSLPHKRQQSQSSDARMSMVTVHSDISSGLLNQRPSLV